jgi:hypothetical protein
MGRTGFLDKVKSNTRANINSRCKFMIGKELIYLIERGFGMADEGRHMRAGSFLSEG